MPLFTAHRTVSVRAITYFTGLVAGALPLPLLAAEAESSAGWNLVIVLIVLAAATSSGALPMAAARQWQGLWRAAALFPFVVLLAWVSLIIFARSIDPTAHALWTLEIFAWAMLTLIYMVSAMTIKRIFEKADAAQSGD